MSMEIGWRVGVLAALAAAGSGTYGSDSLRGRPFDLPAFVEALRKEGGTVHSGDEVEQPFFTVKGRFVSVNGEDVQAFQYGDQTGAERAAATVSRDGATIGTSSPFWAGPPHFYRKGLLIVLYVGDSASVRGPLERVLGPQFAGR